MDNYPVKTKKGRVFPLKMKLYDDNGNELTENDLPEPPVVQVKYSRPVGNGVWDQSHLILYSGKGTDGNQFVFDSNGIWQFNLQSKNYSAPGTYEVVVISGEPLTYRFEPTCVTGFIIE